MIRNRLGLSPVRENVLAAGSAEEAKELRGALIEGKHILSAFEDVDLVIDLTGS